MWKYGYWKYGMALTTLHFSVAGIPGKTTKSILVALYLPISWTLTVMDPMLWTKSHSTLPSRNSFDEHEAIILEHFHLYRTTQSTFAPFVSRCTKNPSLGKLLGTILNICPWSTSNVCVPQRFHPYILCRFSGWPKFGHKDTPFAVLFYDAYYDGFEPAFVNAFRVLGVRNHKLGICFLGGLVE